MPSVAFFLPVLTFAVVLLSSSGTSAGALTRVSLGVAPVEAGRYVPDSVTTLVQAVIEKELAAESRVDLIERSRLQDVLREVSFQQSGLTKRASATPIGQHANVAAIVFAQVSKAGERYDRSGYNLTLKVVDVATNRVVWTESGALGKGDREVVGVTGRIARRLAFMALSFSPAEMVFVPAGSLHMGSKAGCRTNSPCT